MLKVRQIYWSAERRWCPVQISYARQLITLEQRSRVFNIMQRFRLPMWHTVCHPSLFLKVGMLPCAMLLSFCHCHLYLCLLCLKAL